MKNPMFLPEAFKYLFLERIFECLRHGICTFVKYLQDSYKKETPSFCLVLKGPCKTTRAGGTGGTLISFYPPIEN